CGLSNKQWRNHPRFRLRRRRRLQLLGLISLRQENPAAPRLAAVRALGPAFRSGERSPVAKTCKLMALSKAPSGSKVTNSRSALPLSSLPRFTPGTWLSGRADREFVTFDPDGA